MHAGPTLSFGADKHQGSSATFLTQVKDGRWIVVTQNLSQHRPAGDEIIAC